MHCLIISCSHRAHSNSLRVSQTIESLIVNHQNQETCQLFDLHKTPLPMWQESMWQADSDASQAIRPFTTAVNQATSLIWVVPEYAGMASPAAKNALLMINSQIGGHKPCLLVTVSAGPAGSYPIAELRLSSYKNSRIVWIPDHVIIRYADHFKQPFTEDPHQQTFKRLAYSIKLLHEYALALKQLRQSEVLSEQPYPFGV